MPLVCWYESRRRFLFVDTIIFGHIVGRDKSTANIDFGHDSIVPSLSYQAKAHVAATDRFHVTLG